MLTVYKPGTTQWGFCGHLLETPVLCEGQCSPVLQYPLLARLRQHIREIQRLRGVDITALELLMQ